MKTIWTIIVTLAMANILVVGGLLGWLSMTDRLSMDRIEEVRTMFAETVSERDARLEQEASAANAERDHLFEAARRGALPRGSNQVLSETFDDSQIEARRLDRVQDDITRQQDELAVRIRAFETARAEFEEEAAAFRLMREEIKAREGDGQFQKSLKTLETLKSDEAHAMLEAMLAQGKSGEVVAYLSEMGARPRTKLIAEFQTQDPALAADLLERLRTYGIDAASE
ncbi:MAG: hypothetical protein KDA21_02960 [Phycisphaerales bacterium]|nr:hypothetical protein [Phycisphaerales bacterium]